MQNCALSGLAGTVIIRVNATIVLNAPGHHFLHKRVKPGVNGPCHYENEKIN